MLEVGIEHLRGVKMATWICCAEAEDLMWLEFLGVSRDTAITHQSHENLLQKFPLCHSGGPLRADNTKGCHRTASINSNQMTGSKSKRLKCQNLSISEGLSGFEWQPRDQLYKLQSSVGADQVDSWQGHHSVDSKRNQKWPGRQGQLSQQRQQSLSPIPNLSPVSDMRTFS